MTFSRRFGGTKVASTHFRSQPSAALQFSVRPRIWTASIDGFARSLFNVDTMALGPLARAHATCFALALFAMGGVAFIGAGCSAGQSTPTTRDVPLAPPRTVAEVTAQVPDGAVLIALDVVAIPGRRLSLRLSTPTRDATTVVEQYVRALKPHVAEVTRLLASDSSEDPEETAATARELSDTETLLVLPATPESLLVSQVRLRGDARAIAAFSNHFSKSDGTTP